MDNISTDTWTISLPSDWLEKGSTEAGAHYFESPDGEKGIYISTWNVGNQGVGSANEVAKSFKATDARLLLNMEGYSWRTIKEQTTHTATSATVVVDNLAEAKSYRIVGKILASPPIVVRASFHDYGCSNYSASQAFLAPIIESLQLYQSYV